MNKRNCFHVWDFTIYFKLKCPKSVTNFQGARYYLSKIMSHTMTKSIDVLRNCQSIRTQVDS